MLRRTIAANGRREQMLRSLTSKRSTICSRSRSYAYQRPRNGEPGAHLRQTESGAILRAALDGRMTWPSAGVKSRERREEGRQEGRQQPQAGRAQARTVALPPVRYDSSKGSQPPLGPFLCETFSNRCLTSPWHPGLPGQRWAGPASGAAHLDSMLPYCRQPGSSSLWVDVRHCAS
jgi:hypothetical protein